MIDRRILALFEAIRRLPDPGHGDAAAPDRLHRPGDAVDPGEVNRRQGEVFPFTPPFNFTGQPSMSLPLAWSQSGLPIGMMFTGRYADEATLFRLAAQLEKEAPWRDRRPEIWN